MTDQLSPDCRPEHCPAGIKAESAGMGTSSLLPERSPNGCLSSGTPREYARILARGYLAKPGVMMTEQAPLVRQWILLRTLSALRNGTRRRETPGCVCDHQNRGQFDGSR